MPDRTEGLLRAGVRDVRTPDAVRELLSANFPPDQGPYELVEQLRAVGERKARAEGVAYELEHGRPIVLSRLATEFSVAHSTENLSEAKLERMNTRVRDLTAKAAAKEEAPQPERRGLFRR